VGDHQRILIAVCEIIILLFGMVLCLASGGGTGVGLVLGIYYLRVGSLMVESGVADGVIERWKFMIKEADY